MRYFILAIFFLIPTLGNTTLTGSVAEQLVAIRDQHVFPQSQQGWYTHWNYNFWYGRNSATWPYIQTWNSYQAYAKLSAIEQSVKTLSDREKSEYPNLTLEKISELKNFLMNAYVNDYYRTYYLTYYYYVYSHYSFFYYIYNYFNASLTNTQKAYSLLNTLLDRVALVPTKLVAVNGDKVINAPTNSSMSLSVVVYDQFGNKLPNVKVLWKKTSSFQPPLSAHVLNSGSLSSATTISSSEGIATNLVQLSSLPSTSAIEASIEHSSVIFNVNSSHQNEENIEIMVDDFATKGDGISDDRIPIQRALNYAQNISKGNLYCQSLDNFNGCHLYTGMRRLNGEVTLKLGAKTYLLDSFNENYTIHQLRVFDYADKDFSFNIVGSDPDENGVLRSRLITGQTKGVMLGAAGNWINSKIENVVFENVSSYATHYKAAFEMFPTGTNKSHGPKNWSISNNEFRSFTRALMLGGYDGTSTHAARAPSRT